MHQGRRIITDPDRPDDLGLAWRPCPGPPFPVQSANLIFLRATMSTDQPALAAPSALEGHVPGCERDQRFLLRYREIVEELAPSDEFISGFWYRAAEDVAYTACPGIGDIDFLRRLVIWGVEDLGASEEIAADIGLSFEEAVANVVRHAYPEGVPTWVAVRLSRTGPQVAIDLWDRGERARDPALVQAITGASRTGRPPIVRKGGLGLYLIRRLMDDVQYRVGPEENNLTMLKRVAPE